jgi:ABC-type glycerol-3-phosphate transport system substrate-binding protein
VFFGKTRKRSFVMKKEFLAQAVSRTAGLMALLLVLALAACGGGRKDAGSSSSAGGDASYPKELAKQYYELSRQALDAAFDAEEAAKLAEKTADIDKKVSALSSSDREMYTEELARLTGGGLEDLSGAMQEALGASGGLLDSAKDLVNDPAVKDAQKTVESASKALDAASGMLDTASKLSNDPSLKDAQKAAEAAQQANDALKNLGF